MLSKSSKYAIRGVLYLSLNSNEEKKYSPKDIAEAINIPAPFFGENITITHKEKYYFLDQRTKWRILFNQRE